MIDPSSVAGSPDVRRSWLRSAPPSAVGGVSTVRRHPAGRRTGSRTAVLPVVGEREARAVSAACVRAPVGAELDGPDGVARVLLAPVLDQYLLGAGHHVAGRLETREASADHAAVGGGPGRRRARVSPARRRARASRADGRTCRGRRRRGSSGSSGRAPSREARDPSSCARSSRRFANTVGVVSERLSKTLITPLFSATKTRPSEAKRTTVGLVRPLKATVSWKPLGTAALADGAPRTAPTANRQPSSTTAATPRSRRRCNPMSFERIQLSPEASERFSGTKLYHSLATSSKSQANARNRQVLANPPHRTLVKCPRKNTEPADPKARRFSGCTL